MSRQWPGFNTTGKFGGVLILGDQFVFNVGGGNNLMTYGSHSKNHL